jgi:hypothetical protein
MGAYAAVRCPDATRIRDGDRVGAGAPIGPALTVTVAGVLSPLFYLGFGAWLLGSRR